MRVLIADDQKSVGTSLADLVRLRQHEVVEVVGSGLEALDEAPQLFQTGSTVSYLAPKGAGGEPGIKIRP